MHGTTVRETKGGRASFTSHNVEGCCILHMLSYCYRDSISHVNVFIMSKASNLAAQSALALQSDKYHFINPLNAELNPICCLLALLGAHHFLHISRIRVKSTLRLLMSYIYIWSTHS